MPRALPRRALVACAAVGVALFVLTGCTTEPPVNVPSPTPTITSGIVPIGDGVLRIGTLFPTIGDAAASGAAQVAGTELAARTVADEGGIPGRTIELIHRNSAGDVAAAVADLVARGADVVLWDAATTPTPEVAASVTEAGLAFLALGEFANGGTPLATDEAFTARLKTADPGLAATAGGAESYDGVILTALAATAVGDDAAASVEIGWETVAAGPTVCTSWGECVAALVDAQSIEYQGITGVRS
ncbi:hypothetical protein D6T64_03770 [Cryobacterium melibiosiphilum]|uniref:Leucine-binding protein domain-containing protein n=1 Tax=Cryobacterium melibiosiphilum TaxID=995039 RepID=A0A3A5MTQ3_9MICO|nr:ABC transporter substrate-binding protein [Cryobacterium melibiosiphilum]RJT90528.1 hypothetical protein D6T64_03770 [Cryobacterium melibiosiphilum]